MGSCSALDQAWRAGREGVCSPVFQRASRQSSGLKDFPASSAARSENGSLKGSTICGRVKMVVGILMDWSVGRSDPGGCCSGQLFAVVVMGGAATPKGVFCCTHNPCHEPDELWQ
eukprot:scaffold27266_cov159-Isochrysis_galbana.AAC.1